MNDMAFNDFGDDVSLEAEHSVIGSVLLNGPSMFDAASLRADEFSTTLHQILWSELGKLVGSGRHIDLITLMDAMRGIDVDWGYVNQIAQSVSYSSTSSVSRHAEIIRDQAKYRALKSAAREVEVIASDETATIEQRVSRSVSTLEGVIGERTDSTPLPVADFMVDFMDRLQDMADGKIIPGRPTHIPSLDRMLSGGTRDQQLIVVAARPSVGKSSFAQNISLSNAKDGIPAAFFGMEMTSKELTNRTVANLGRAPLSGIKTGKMSSEDWGRVTDGVEAMRELPLFLYDQAAMTLAEVSSKARFLVRRHGIKTLVVDYLQLMKGSGGRVERRTELEEITRGMKQLAKQLNITVILLSQLNRSVEQRSNPRPIMSDLKECGAIEEDADVILALWNHKKGDGADIKGCSILKNRDGETGEIALHFEGQYQRWSESTESLIGGGGSGGGNGRRFTNDL